MGNKENPKRDNKNNVQLNWLVKLLVDALNNRMKKEIYLNKILYQIKLISGVIYY